MAVVGGIQRLTSIGLRRAGRFGAGLLIIVGTGAACAQAAPSASAGPGTGTDAVSVTSSVAADRSVPMVWTELDDGERIRHPAGWHAFPLPLGITPGSHVVVALSTGTANPCRWQVSGTATQGVCWGDRLPGGGVEIIWATQLPKLRPEAPSRTWSAADAECASLGGARSLVATVPLPGEGLGRRRFVVSACLADPGSADNQRYVDGMLDSLRPSGRGPSGDGSGS